MSDTITTRPAITSDNSLTAQQFILGLFSMAIVAGTVGAVFYRGNDAAINVALGFVFGSLGAGVSGFYFGSSKGSQNKDGILAMRPAPPTTTTVTAPPATVTTTTGTTS